MSELSELLKNRREELKRTLSEASADTRIRIQFLESMEKGDFKSLPSYLHAYGFVKQYAEYLGFAYDEIKGLFDAECPKNPQPVIQQDDGQSPEAEKKSGAGKTAAIVCVLAVLCAAAWFGYLKFYDWEKNGVSPVFPVSKTDTLGDDDAPVPAENDFHSVSPVSGSEVPQNGQGHDAEENPPAAVAVAQSEAGGVQDGGVSIPVFDNGTVSAAMPLGVSGDGVRSLQEEDNSVKYVTLTFSGNCWVLFVSDTGKTEEFSASDGTVKRMPFIKGFTITIGNAAAISMRYGQQFFTNFGGEGMPVRGLRYSLEDGSLIGVRGR